MEGKKKKILFLGITLFIFLLFIGSLSFYFLFYLSSGDAEGYGVTQESVSPRGRYLDATEATIAANEQLMKMEHGNIKTIDTGDPDYQYDFYLDHEMGNIYYWDIMDSEIEVYIRADTGEIIFYDNLGYVDGSKTEQEINESADLIVKQFSELPTDSGSPENVYLDDLLGFIECDPVTGNETDTYYSYWQVIYSRYHSNVMTDDFIKILLLPNGDCSLYKKVWNMDLSRIEDKPHHTSREAQEKAIDYVLANGGVDVTVNETELKIVRPTYEGYRDTVLYGKDPVLAWYVTLYDEQGNIWYVTVKDSDRSIIEVDYIL